MASVRRSFTIHVCVFLLSTAVRAQPSLPTLESLAVAWSGSTTAPLCTTEAAALDARIVSEVCIWRRSRESWAPYELGGHRQSGHPLAELTWHTSVGDSTLARAFRDSVGRTLRAYPLQTHECPDAGRFWQAAGMYIHFTIGGRQPSGRLNVSVIATTFPMPPISQLLCPGIPLISPSMPVPHSRIGAVSQTRAVGAGRLTRVAADTAAKVQ